MANLIPIAGAGARFAKAGYPLPKPLIVVDGIPMVRHAMRSLPKTDRWVVICQKEHVEKFGLEKTVREEAPNAIIVTVDEITAGQAITCMEARPFLNPEEPLFIGACDVAPKWDIVMFDLMVKKEKPDAVVFTFRHDQRLEKNPESFGWVKVNDNDLVQGISIKVPISNHPFDDHAIVGYFYFRTAQIMFDAIEQMVEEQRKTNNEFYLDGCVQTMAEHGQKVMVFEVDRFIGWGTPEEFENYNKKKGNL